MRRETPAFAQQKWPGSTLYRYGICELAQRQAVFVRKDKPSDRAIKSDRAKVVMTAGSISKIFDIPNYIYILMEIANSANQNLNTKKDCPNVDSPYHQILLSHSSTQKKLTTTPDGRE